MQSFDCVTVLFCELVGFNSNTVQDAMDVVTCMNAVFSCFDELMDKFNVYKVENVKKKRHIFICNQTTKVTYHALTDSNSI